MKNSLCSLRSIGCLCALLSLPLVPAAGNAQPFSIDTYTIYGGGTSTGDLFSISGTIGQHDAGQQVAGGRYSLVGGFQWPYGVQTPGGPPLKVSRINAGTAIISWPWPSTNWQLQQNASLSTTNWTAPSETITNDGTNNFIMVDPRAARRFYRLAYSPPASQ